MPASPDRTTVALPADVDLHARPAATLVRVAMGFTATVTLAYDGREADARSLLSVLALGAKAGSELTLDADGADAAEALDAVRHCLTGLTE